jgi:hypothetical protein
LPCTRAATLPAGHREAQVDADQAGRVVTQGLVLAAAWAELAVLLGVLAWFVVRRGPR